MKYCHIPYYKGITIRRTTPMLTKPGAIWDEARALYKEFDPTAKIRLRDMKIKFGPVTDPEKRAEVSFTHFERAENTDNFQGSQLSSAVLDELCQFEESQFLYILSRLRTKADMKPVIRATMNPDVDSWVKKWVQYYLYPEGHEHFGRPDPEKQALVRWFIRNGDDMVWTESREEMFEKHGKRDSSGKLLPEDDRRQIKPLSFAFIFASVYDNPYIDDNYIAFLEGLSRVEKEILLYGSWEARPVGSTYYKREDLTEIVEVPPDSDFSKIVRAYDFAGTLPHDGNKETDYFASVKMGKLHTGDYVILEVVRTRITFGDWEQHILDNAFRDGNKVEIILPQDPNAAAKAATSLLARSIIEHGYIVRTKRSSMGKLDSFRPFAAAVENGNISLVKGCATDLWNKIYNDNDFFHKELEAFDGKRRGGQHHDDMVDCCSLAFSTLAQRVHIPSFIGGLSSADLRQPNPFRSSAL